VVPADSENEVERGNCMTKPTSLGNGLTVTLPGSLGEAVKPNVGTSSGEAAIMWNGPVTIIAPELVPDPGPPPPVPGPPEPLGPGEKGPASTENTTQRESTTANTPGRVKALIFRNRRLHIVPGLSSR